MENVVYQQQYADVHLKLIISGSYISDNDFPDYAKQSRLLVRRKNKIKRCLLSNRMYGIRKELTNLYNPQSSDDHEKNSICYAAKYLPT